MTSSREPEEPGLLDPDAHAEWERKYGPTRKARRPRSSSMAVPGVILLLLILALAWWGTRDVDEQASQPGNTATSESRPRQGSLTRSKACGEFFDIAADLTLSDDQSAARFHALASRTRDSDLADAIREVGDKFAAHADEISSEEVLELCDQ
jgi:hypothetical protein